MNDIFNLTFKKDETYIGNHLKLTKSGMLYMTYDFASYLAKDGYDLSKKHSYIPTKYHIVYSNIYRCDLYIKKTNNNSKFEYYLLGSSGSHGFNGMQDTKKETLGIRTVRRANKYIFDIYIESPLSRSEKIKIIKSKI